MNSRATLQLLALLKAVGADDQEIAEAMSLVEKGYAEVAQHAGDEWLWEQVRQFRNRAVNEALFH